MVEQLCERLRAFDTPTLSNAIEAFHVRPATEGYASSDIRCQFPDLPPMVGYAVTCLIDSTSPRPPTPNRQRNLVDMIIASGKPVIVVAQAVGPERERSCCFGDVLATLYRRLGAVGAVTDGASRDFAGIRRNAPGFQLFCSGSVASHGSHTIVEVGTPVTVGGMHVEPGDLLHGDANGLLSVPLAIAEAVIERAEAVKRNEMGVLAAIAREPFEIDAVIGGIRH